MSPLKFAHNSHTSSPVFVFHSTTFALKDLTLIFKNLYELLVFSLVSFLLVYIHSVYRGNYSLCFNLHFTLCVWMPYSYMLFGFLSTHEGSFQTSSMSWGFEAFYFNMIQQFSSHAPPMHLFFSLIVKVRFFFVFSFMSIHLSLHKTISPSSDLLPPKHNRNHTLESQ